MCYQCVLRLVGHDILTGGDHLVSSGQWDPVKTYEAGLFVMEDSGGWDRAHLVYLPYCSSDAHMGDTAEDTGELGTIQVAASPGLGYDDLCDLSTEAGGWPGPP